MAVGGIGRGRRPHGASGRLMFDHLQIYDRRERALVAAADVGLRFLGPALTLGRRRMAGSPRRVLLLRLERIGDLLMSLDAIDDVRQALPSARIDLVVGSWNLDLARRIRGLHGVEALDAGWLARDRTGLGLAAMLRHTREWRRRRYDLAVNFEPDIRSNLLLAASRAARTAGFSSAGGGPLLDVALRHDPRAHTADNGRRLVSALLEVPPRAQPARLELKPAEREGAARRLDARRRPAIGIHASGGRQVKQWDVERFGELAFRLATAHGATIVLTGGPADRAMVDAVARRVPPEQAIDVAGALDLPTLAAVLERLDLFVTGDTGPMHLAAAVGTPTVAIFGPSDPARYAPRDPMHEVVRVDLPCSPCNRIRLPPERCRGIIPDCLTSIDVEMVYGAVERTLTRRHSSRGPVGAAQG